jgi:hypothetical protein
MFWRIKKFEEAILAYQDGKKKASRERNPQEWLKCTRSIGVTAAKLAMTEILHVDKTIQWIKTISVLYLASLNALSIVLPPRMKLTLVGLKALS